MRLNYDDIKTTIKNKELCKEFPFLIPIESVGKEYNYLFTELDNVSDGWRELFLEMCKELKKLLNPSKNFGHLQVKRNGREVLFYQEPCDKEILKEVGRIINLYNERIEKTCMFCGAGATYIELNGHRPCCDNCVVYFAKLHKNLPVLDIKSYLKGE